MLIVTLLQCCRRHHIQFIIVREVFANDCLWRGEVVTSFGCFDISDPLHRETRIFRFRAHFCSEGHSPALKFCVVREFSKMHSRCLITRVCHVTLSISSNARSMVMCHKTLDNIHCHDFSLLPSPTKARHRYCLHWLSALTFLKSIPSVQSRRLFPNFLNHCVIRQDFVEQVDRQNTFPGILISSRVLRSNPDSRPGFLLELEATRG